MFDTSRLTASEREVLVDALDFRINFFEAVITDSKYRADAAVRLVLRVEDVGDDQAARDDPVSRNASWKLWQARELRDALR